MMVISAFLSILEAALDTYSPPVPKPMITILRAQGGEALLSSISLSLFYERLDSI
jgi:hypothetical protein